MTTLIPTDGNWQESNKAGKAAGCPVIAVPNDYTRGQDFSEADWVEPDLFAAARRVEKLLS
jgi:beta-phosphoglucomutase-like phosphatase (HAD superfamily)